MNNDTQRLDLFAALRPLLARQHTHPIRMTPDVPTEGRYRCIRCLVTRDREFFPRGRQAMCTICQAESPRGRIVRRVTK